MISEKQTGAGAQLIRADPGYFVVWMDGIRRRQVITMADAMGRIRRAPVIMWQVDGQPGAVDVLPVTPVGWVNERGGALLTPDGTVFDDEPHEDLFQWMAHSLSYLECTIKHMRISARGKNKRESKPENS